MLSQTKMIRKISELLHRYTICFKVVLSYVNRDYAILLLLLLAKE